MTTPYISEDITGSRPAWMRSLQRVLTLHDRLSRGPVFGTELDTADWAADCSRKQWYRHLRELAALGAPLRCTRYADRVEYSYTALKFDLLRSIGRMR